MLVDHHATWTSRIPAADLDGARSARRVHVGTTVTISTRIRVFDQVLAVAERLRRCLLLVSARIRTTPHEELDFSRPISCACPASEGRRHRLAGLDYHYKYSTPEAQGRRASATTSPRRARLVCRSRSIA